MDNYSIGTILLAGDSETEPSVLEKIEGCGYSFIRTKNCSSAIDIIREGNVIINLVLVDTDAIKGPGDADAAASIIDTHDLPLLFIHSCENDDAIHKTGLIASYGYLDKNSDKVLFQLSINAALKRSEIQKRFKAEKKEEQRLSEEKFRLFAAALNDVIFMLDTSGRFTYVSPVIEKLSGYTPSEITGKLFHEFIFPEDLPGLIESFRKTISGKIEPYECRMLDCSGNIRHVRTSSGQVYNDGVLQGLIGVLVDITDSKHDKEKIIALLREKELILKEVHHRVKNNMNTIFALLRLQAEGYNNHETETILIDAASRVHSMSVLYDRLYRSETEGSVSLKDYLPQLINEIIRIFPGGESVNAVIRVDDVSLRPEKLSAVGIIINEFITNTMKYGLNSKGLSIIEVTAEKNGERLSVSYGDNGPGFPDPGDLRKAGGFGMQLIEMLVEQIRGSMKFERPGLSKVIIDFPIE